MYDSSIPRFLLLLVASLGISPALASSVSNPTTLVLWNLPVRPPATPVEMTARQIKLQFLDQFPQISIEHGGGPQFHRFGKGTREFLMAQAGGIAPDVIQMNDVDVQDYMGRHFLLPLNDFLRETGILKKMLEHPLAEQFQRDGMVYAIPVGPCQFPTYAAIGPFAARPYSYALFYRKDVFRHVGLDPERKPTDLGLVYYSFCPLP